MSVYLDVNVLIPLFMVDAHNKRADKAMNDLQDDLIVSNLSVAEFSSVIARRVRMHELNESDARSAFVNFDAWCADHTSCAEIENVDFLAATALMRRLNLPLRTPDALHLAVVQRNGCSLLTFDTAMAKVARALRIEIAP